MCLTSNLTRSCCNRICKIKCNNSALSSLTGLQNSRKVCIPCKFSRYRYMYTQILQIYVHKHDMPCKLMSVYTRCRTFKSV